MQDLCRQMLQKLFSCQSYFPTKAKIFQVFQHFGTVRNVEWGQEQSYFFKVFLPQSNTAHHFLSHIFGNKSDHKFLHQKDHILVIRLIVKKDIRQRINVHLEIVVTTKDLEAEEICSQSEASRRQKALFFLFFSVDSYSCHKYVS